MGKFRISMLSKSDMEQVHSASLGILERSGAIVRSAQARRLLSDMGAKVDEKGLRVWIPERLVKESLGSVAREFVLGARDRKHDLEIPSGGFPYISTDGFPVQIKDSETLEKRPSTRSDLEKWAILADWLPTVDFLWPSAGATDIPSQIQLLGGLRTCYENTSKHIQYQAFSGQEALLEAEMAAAVAGGEDENRKRPHFSSVQCIVAPLQYDEGSTDAVIEFARLGIPVVAMTMVTPGITGPATIAGSVALANAEVLASNVISQAASKGARVFYCYVCAPLDMRSGNFATGSPEYGLLSVAGAEMAKFYRFPSMMGGMGTSTKAAQMQTGFEKAITTFGPALAGCDLITGVGGLNDAAYVSMEQMLMDAQVWEDIKRSWQGIEVNESEIAMDVIEKVGPKGQYLNNAHTFANFRRLHASRFSDRGSYTAWEKGGKRDMFATAHDEVKKVLGSHKPLPLSKEIAARLAAVEKRGTKVLA